MITIANAIDRIIAIRPTWGEALMEDIVNFSALARKMQPLIEEILLEEVTEGAVVMALRRRAAQIVKERPQETVHPIRNITVRSDISEVAFESTANLNKIHQKLLAIGERYDDPFLAYGQGSAETTFDLSNVLLPHLLELAKGERQIATFRNLSAISVRMPLETVTMPGVYYPFIKALAWEQINVYQVISYFTEVNFIVEDKDIDRAFSLIKSLAKRAHVLS